MTTIKQKDFLHHLSPMSNWKKINQEGGRKIISKGEGIYLWDIDGNCYLDGMSGLWCVNVGYSCQSIKDAIKKQLQELPYYNSFFKTSTLPTAELSELLSQITPPHINHFFYGCTGSDANDTVFKMISRYWHNKGEPQRKIVISRKNSYHGSTFLAANLGGMPLMHALNGFLLEEIVHIEQPYTFDAGKPFNDKDFGLICAAYLEEKIIECGVDKVAAFIGEPIQGAGGVIIPPDSYWPEIERICKKYKILLVSDEVICGFGRTGKWFGCENWSVNPDFMTLAKGITSGYIPLSAVGVSDHVHEVLMQESNEFSHGYTYSGHPVACQAALANLHFLINNRILEQLTTTTIPYFQQLGEKLTDHPLLGEVRSKGMLMAFELVKNKKTRERFKKDIGSICRDLSFANGFIMRACEQKLVLAPPLVIKESELDKLFVLIKKVFDLALEKVDD
jgi:putrescine aminotransferase